MRSLQTIAAPEVLRCEDCSPSSFSLLAALSAGAQQIGQNKAAGRAGDLHAHVKSQLVVETVVVKDKQGNFVHGLTAKDFTVTEDGVPQTISFCEHQDLPQSRRRCPSRAPGTEDIKIYNQPARARRSRPKPRTASATRIAACWRSTST